MTADQARAPHSAEFFGPVRDYWWSEDYLESIAARLGLELFGRCSTWAAAADTGGG